MKIMSIGLEVKEGKGKTKKKKKFGLFQKRARETAPTPRLPDTAKMAAEG